MSKLSERVKQAKKEISEILWKVTQEDDRYWLNKKYIRWGRVEKDIHAIAEKYIYVEYPSNKE
jgi:hypothetical protein